jgi:hypothetical protein
MKRLCSLLIVIALLLILFAGGTPKVQKNLEYRLTEKGSDIAVRDPSPSIAVFTEEGDFNTFYNYLHMNKIPLPGPPEIDFSGSLLLFVSYGEQRTAGYFIEVKKVYDRKGTLVVQAVLLGPPEGSMSAQVITCPYLLMTVPSGDFHRVELVDGIGEVQAYKSL